MDEKLEDRAALLSRIEILEREKSELRSDIEQMCMQHVGPSYGAVATRMHFQRTAGLEQEIDDLKKKLTSCLRENVNLQEELSQAYHIKNQLADLHRSELTKSLEAEKQIKFFQGCVGSAFSERDNAIMEAEKAKEKEELATQKLGIIEQKIEELNLVVLEEKKVSSTLQTDLQNQNKQNEIFKQVITKFYDIRQHSLNEYDDLNFEDKCTTLLNDTEDMWSFNSQEETSTTKYITALEEEVEALRKNVINLRTKLQMGLEIEKHLKKVVRDLKNKKIFLEEKMKRDVSVIRDLYSQHRIDIMNLLKDEFSQFQSYIDAIKENVGQIYKNEEELNNLSFQKDIKLQENEIRDVHIISPDIASDTITKENVSEFQKSCSTQTGDDSGPLAQALQEKVATLLLLSQQEERYLLERNVKAALESKMEELQRNLIQVTNEKVVALMELAQLKQEYRLLQEKVNDDKEEKSNIQDRDKDKDKDGRLKSLLKKTYFSQWINPYQEYAHNIISNKSSSATMDFARMKVEYISLKESLESMEHLTCSIRRLRLSLIKAKESNTVSEIIENVVTEAKLLKTAIGSSVPISWLTGDQLDTTSEEKVDGVSLAGFEMVELLILASHLLKNSMS